MLASIRLPFDAELRTHISVPYSNIGAQICMIGYVHISNFINGIIWSYQYLGATK